MFLLLPSEFHRVSLLLPQWLSLLFLWIGRGQRTVSWHCNQESLQDCSVAVQRGLRLLGSLCLVRQITCTTPFLSEPQFPPSASAAQTAYPAHPLGALWGPGGNSNLQICEVQLMCCQNGLLSSHKPLCPTAASWPSLTLTSPGVVHLSDKAVGFPSPLVCETNTRYFFLFSG